jgi:ABC-type multidrug transport system ATPase subunit
MTASNDGSIVARGLGLLTPGGWVYREIDFDVPQGALALVTGPAGCGKTALLLTVAGRMRASEGALRLGDCDAVAQPQRARRLVGLGETAGVNDLDPTLTVADQVKAELALHGRRRRRSDVVAALEPVGLALDARVKVDDLHAADRLLLGVALAAIGEPPFLVVDDVHEDLTPAEHVLALARLRELTTSGTTIVAGCLDPALATLADVVLCLGLDGRPVAGSPVADSPSPDGSVADSPTPTAPRKEADRALV